MDFAACRKPAKAHGRPPAPRARRLCWTVPRGAFTPPREGRRDSFARPQRGPRLNTVSTRDEPGEEQHVGDENQ